MDLIKLEIEQLKHQIELIDAVYTEQTKKKVSICENFSIKYYYESILHKLGYCNRKEE
jgi:hypothetical protein